MEIQTYSPYDDASTIKGFTIVIDVFRAFSVSYYIDNNGPQKYIISESIEHSQNLKNLVSNSILIGERQGIKIEGFDFGNSPTEIYENDFSGKTIIHTTTAGTKGLLLQPHENEVVVGSFVNAQALLNYIEKNKIQKVNFYCTARPKGILGEEDYLFADYMTNKLLDRDCKYDEIINSLRKGSGKGFLETDFAPYTDFLYCLDVNRFDSILRRKIVKESTHRIELERWQE